MVNTFLFSRDHLIILLLLSIFLYFCPRLTKNLLPYSYFIEKIICFLIIFEVVFEQALIVYMKQYSVLTSLPISISRFTSYMCILILFFKKYELFNVFFSWSLVSCIGELIIFKDIGCRFPNFIYYTYIFSRLILLYANVYMTEVRKFRISKSAIKDNLFMCLIYFSFILLLNIFTKANYTYVFSTYNILSIPLFILITSIVYIPSLLSDSKYIKFNLKRREK